MKVSQSSREAAAARTREHGIGRRRCPGGAPRQRGDAAVRPGLVVGAGRPRIPRVRTCPAPGGSAGRWRYWAATALVARGIFLGRPVTTAHAMYRGRRGGCRLGRALPVLRGGARQCSGCRQWARADATRHGPTAAGAAGPGVGAGQHHQAGSLGAVRHAFEQELSLQRRRHRGDRLPHAAWVRRRRRRPDWRCGAIRNDLVADFVRMCRGRGWRIIVLAAGERHLRWWRRDTVGQPMLSVPIGRDVVVDIRHFTLRGRRFRNLRPAVQRTHNCGVTTEIVDEQKLGGAGGRADRGFVRRPPRGDRPRVLHEPRRCAARAAFPGVTLAIARDGCGRVVAFHRYLTAGGGIGSQPRRRPPPGCPQRRRRAAQRRHDRSTRKILAEQRLSLAFAAFPEIFEAVQPGATAADRALADPPAGPADPAEVPVPLPPQVPCAVRAALCGVVRSPYSGCADGLAVAGIRAAPAPHEV